MHRLTVISLIASCLCLMPTVSAQIKIIPQERLDAVNNPVLSEDSSFLVFDMTHIVADPMNEEDAPKVFVFPFRNEGKKRIDIRRMVSTCSCAVASCSVRSLSSGESAEISVRYDPKGHPGHFERKVFIYTDDGDAPAAVLRLSVQVESGKDLSADWPVQKGSVRMRRDEVSFTEGTRSVEKIRFINLSGKVLRLDCERAFLPACLSFRTEPEVVGNGEEGEMVFSYDPSETTPKDRVNVMLKGLGLPPSRSSVTVCFRPGN